MFGTESADLVALDGFIVVLSNFRAYGVPNIFWDIFSTIVPTADMTCSSFSITEETCCGAFAAAEEESPLAPSGQYSWHTMRPSD